MTTAAARGIRARTSPSAPAGSAALGRQAFGHLLSAFHLSVAHFAAVAIPARRTEDRDLVGHRFAPLPAATQSGKINANASSTDRSSGRNRGIDGVVRR